MSKTTQLPGKKAGAGKFVVMLSSVAKPPPDDEEYEGLLAPPAKPGSADSPQPGQTPPPLAPKQGSQAQPRPSVTPHVKLPPKTTVLPQVSMPAKPLIPPVEKPSTSSKIAPAPLPAKWSEPAKNDPKKAGAQHIPAIRLNESSLQADDPGESIFPKTDQPALKPSPKPEGWKSLEPGELNPPAGGLQSLEVFERSQSALGKSAPKTPSPEVKEKAPHLVAPPLLPPTRVATPVPAMAALHPPVRPPPLPPPSAKPSAVTTQPHPVAPPMLEKAPEPPKEKLPQPNLPTDARKSDPDISGSPVVQKVPALAQPDAPSAGKTPPALPPKPLTPPASATVKGPGNWLKKSTPLVLSSYSPKVEPPKVVETKPALKPAVLPKRSLPLPGEALSEVSEETIDKPKVEESAKKEETAKKSDTPVLAGAPLSATPTPIPEPASTAKQPDAPSTGKTPAPEKQEKTEAKVSPGKPQPDVTVSTKSTRPMPETRVARAKKRRSMETVFFWAVIVPLTAVALFIGSLNFCRDTRVEGQIIPPPGMTLNTEVWIVSDFRELASGIAEDLAAERTPLMQEIQERQDHVQRVQADVASREERIRLDQEQIQASKDEIAAVGKQAADATQQMWDGEGAQIDAEYQAHYNQLKQAIADRAKSLNLKYQPDEAFPSPEVWANAYRLALYDVPAGVDGVKEHAWLGDEMKQWRDFLKTLDDRKEQLREKAAELKTATGPKVADLTAKIQDLQQRLDGTSAEEVPLKVELQQAQADLAQAQAADAGLDEKYYKQLDALPEEAITKHIPLLTNGRFTWIDDDIFSEGEKEHGYWLFARATRADGRQYWALHRFSISKNQMLELTIEPNGFISTKAILRPNLPPEEQEQ